MTLHELRSIEDLNIALEESHKRPILLFKHSLTCSVSTTAFSELKSHLERADSRISYKLVTVQTSRAVSDEAAFKLGVTHQSPQAILVRNGDQLWNASHFDITASALEKAIHRAIGSDAPAAD